MFTAAIVVATLLAPAQVPQGRRFVLDGSASVQFEISTSSGIIRGEIPVAKLETRGLEGWGRFDFRLVLSPQKVKSGDRVRDAFIASSMLLAEEGPLSIASTERKAPIAGVGKGTGPNDEKWSIGAWLDPRRGRRYQKIYYSFVIDESKTRGRLEIEHRTTLKELGFPPLVHPFVEITGPVLIRLSADLTRS